MKKPTSRMKGCWSSRAPWWL